MGSWAPKVQRLAAALGDRLVAVAMLADPASAAERTDQDRGARRFADRRLSASGERRHSRCSSNAALKAKGLAVEVANAGVSGDTSSGGLARLDWSVPDGTDAVILELGANDMLRGVDPKVTREALTEIVRRLKARHIEVLLCGMRAAPNFGPDYVRAFDAIYPELAAANDVLFYPFFLEGVVADPKLNHRRRPASDRRRRRQDRGRHFAEGRGAVGAGPAAKSRVAKHHDLTLKS